MKYTTLLGWLITLGQYGVTYAWPAYASFQAIESGETADDTQWLVYWLLFAVLTTLEGIFWPVLQYLPLYQLGKLAVFSFLSLPQTHGAEQVYIKLRPSIQRALKLVNDVAGKGNDQTPKGKELKGLRERIRKVKGEVSTTLGSAYDAAAADGSDVSAVTDAVSSIERALEGGKRELSKQQAKHESNSGSTTHATAPDANIKVSTPTPKNDPFAQIDSALQPST